MRHPAQAREEGREEKAEQNVQAHGAYSYDHRGFGIVQGIKGARQHFNQAAGKDWAQAQAWAQGETDRSVDNVVQITGELDALRYGDLLRPRGLVGLRGVGFSYDGLYYVKNVSHHLRPGQYRQSFTLTREGTGSTVPVVIP